jgi:hypothetical protein
MTIWAILKAIWTARKGLKKADETTDAHRDKLKAKIIERGSGAAILLACLLATGCATSSVRAVREQGGRPTCWERCQLNVCDGVSWLNGAIPFGGGQD